MNPRMRAYFAMNVPKYNDVNHVLVTLNKMSKGHSATFAKGWYIKLHNNGVITDEKTFRKLCEAFAKAFVPKDLKDWACQSIYSLSMT